MEQQPAITMISRKPVKRINKAFYFWSFTVSAVLITLLIVVAVVAIIIAVNAKIGPDDTPLVIISAAGFILLLNLLLVFNVIVSFIPLYKAWAAIQDGHARTSPGKAVGFMFIPYFSFYWMFPAYWGYAKDNNAYLERYSLGFPKMPENLFLADCILTLSSLVFGFIVLPAVIVLDAIILYKICDNINNLAGTGVPASIK
jgi:hypothetical protein